MACKQSFILAFILKVKNVGNICSVYVWHLRCCYAIRLQNSQVINVCA